jgi:hypothetical protein
VGNDQHRAETPKSSKSPTGHQIPRHPCSSSSAPHRLGRPAGGKLAEGHQRLMRQHTYSWSSRRPRQPPRHPTVRLRRQTNQTASRRRVRAPITELIGNEQGTGSCRRSSFPRRHGWPKKGVAYIRHVRT